MTIRKRRPHTKATRPRGAATCLCPVTPIKRGRAQTACAKLTKVLRTTRSATTGNVLRHRQCTAGHRFTTEEIPNE